MGPRKCAHAQRADPTRLPHKCEKEIGIGTIPITAALRWWISPPAVDMPAISPGANEPCLRHFENAIRRRDVRRGNACLTIRRHDVRRANARHANPYVAYLTAVSLALATIAASSSSVMSMARLNVPGSVVLNVGALPGDLFRSPGQGGSTGASLSSKRRDSRNPRVKPGADFHNINRGAWIAR